MSLIFIAIPTKGTVVDKQLTDEFLRFFARLYDFFPQHTFIAPMIQDYAILRFMPNKETTWEAWGKHCRDLIERSDEVWVLQYDGWDTSVGVRGEIEHAELHGKPVAFVGVDVELDQPAST
jgi:hypothetical protein